MTTLIVCLTLVSLAGIWVGGLRIAKQARPPLGRGEDYRSLAEEYRRLSDLAITAQEHTDLKLTEVSVRLDELRDQLAQLQRILAEVE